MKMKWKVEAKTDHRGGPKIESWERIYANYPEGVRAGKFGSSFGQNVNFGGFGGVIARQGMVKTFFTEYYFSENEIMKSKLS